MTLYSVEITDSVMAAITAEARYIATDARAPLNAARWLEQIWDAVDSLERFPRRASGEAPSEHSLTMIVKAGKVAHL